MINRSSVISIPKDTGPHPSSNLEWWYGYAFLHGSGGRHYAVMASFFRVGETKCLNGHYLIHSFIRLDEQQFTPRSVIDTRLIAKMLAFYLPLSLILRPADRSSWKLLRSLLAGRLPHPHERMKHASVRTGPTDLQYGSARLLFDPDEEGAFTLRLEDRNSAAGLRFTPSKPVTVIDETGALNGLSYYSFTRNRVAGRLQTGVHAEEVTGEGWFDHQWGQNYDLLKGLGWNWFGLQLDDGRELLISQKRMDSTEANSPAKAFLIDKNHTLRSTEHITMKPVRYWKSILTGNRYPVQWLISIPGFSMELRVQPFMNKQEMPIIGPLRAIWEGAVYLTGAERTPIGHWTHITGKGFMELVGYSGP